MQIDQSMDARAASAGGLKDMRFKDGRGGDARLNEARLSDARSHSAGAIAAWSLVRPTLKAEFSAKAYQNYVEPLQFLLIEGDRLVFLAQSQTQKLWLDSEARRVIEQRLTAYIDIVQPISICVFKELSPLAQDCARAAGFDESGPTASATAAAQSATGGGRAGRPALSLVEGSAAPAGRTANTFETFQLGAANEKAVRLARLIASKPNSAIQLVLFYGEPGVGKSHLADAICAEIAARDPGRVIRTTKAMAFMEEFQHVIHHRKEDGPAFKARNRDVEVFVIDDVHHLAGKKATEDELFSVVSYHLDAGHLVVMTADAGPEALEGFSERMMHRLRCATECEIGMPDQGLRRAILDSRVAFHAVNHPGFSVAADALDMIAARMEVAGRELDGAISQLVLEWEMDNTPITLARAESALRSRLVGADKRIMIDHVREAAAQHFRMTQQELLRRTRERAVSYPRQVAMYAACKLTSQSLPNIGKYIGNAHHTTVLHARRKITKLVDEVGDDRVRRDVEAVMRLARQLA